MKQKSSLKMLSSQLQKSGEISNFSQAVIQSFTFKKPSICFQGHAEHTLRKAASPCRSVRHAVSDAAVVGSLPHGHTLHGICWSIPKP